jgi:hypothetical protein
LRISRTSTFEKKSVATTRKRKEKKRKERKRKEKKGKEKCSNHLENTSQD